LPAAGFLIAASSHCSRPAVKSFARRAPLDLYSRAKWSRAEKAVSPDAARNAAKHKQGGSPDVSEEISRLLRNGQETIVRDWTEKVSVDRRINSDERLSYLQLVDHIPQIVEEIQYALAAESPGSQMLSQGKEHGRQRWRQGYELKEVVRELTILRATLAEFLERYRGALPVRSPEALTRSLHKINIFMDDEIYKTVEAYLDSSHNPQSN
jgi:hypothetical protein